MSGPATDAELGDHGENDVLRAHAGRQPSIDAHLESLRLALQHALCREDVGDLRRADAEGESAERTMCAGVAVAADDGHPRLREPKLGSDDVHDSLPRVAEGIQRNPELVAVALESLELRAGLRVDRWQCGEGARAGRAAVRRRRVIHRRERTRWPTDAKAARSQFGERLR